MTITLNYLQFAAALVTVLIVGVYVGVASEYYFYEPSIPDTCYIMAHDAYGEGLYDGYHVALKDYKFDGPLIEKCADHPWYIAQRGQEYGIRVWNSEL